MIKKWIFLNWKKRERTIAQMEANKLLEEAREPLFKRICSKWIPKKKTDRDELLKDATYFTALILMFAGCSWLGVPGLGLILDSSVLLFSLFRRDGGQ